MPTGRSSKACGRPAAGTSAEASSRPGRLGSPQASNRPGKMAAPCRTQRGWIRYGTRPRANPQTATSRSSGKGLRGKLWRISGVAPAMRLILLRGPGLVPAKTSQEARWSTSGARPRGMRITSFRRTTATSIFPATRWPRPNGSSGKAATERRFWPSRRRCREIPRARKDGASWVSSTPSLIRMSRPFSACDVATRWIPTTWTVSWRSE
mmetsp:Transcript_20010/g.43662  ORF Transcript_20010/g.43662 Transcript_20010/m.43662 type:complete len:209 (-) Transcript_20010:861-1487(-)